VMVEGSIANSKIRHWRKEVVSSLIYVDWITIECAFEYFRRHMKSQWRKVVEPELKRCRTTRTRNKKRNELNPIFFSNYIIASKLYKDGDVHEIDLTTVSKSEIQKRRLLAGVEGGEYSRQVTNGLLLSN
ncbi:MAG TPA: hypothetical protein PK951_10985, partial [Chitinophagaceae bacterium]|nr:hypothetical protein [Chitinophagaceae bacterium]